MKILQIGDKNSTVENFQKFLIGQGYDLEPDGDFGQLTAIAVRAFQARVGLRADGIVGDSTIAEAVKLGYVAETLPTASSKPPLKKLILISAGHSTVSPRDPGASGNGFVEAKEALRLRDAVAAKLRANGFSVIEDGADGISEPLKKALILADKANIAVEIHFNGSENTSATGIEVLGKPRLKSLCQKLAKAIYSATGIVLRGENGFKLDSSGQHHRLAFCEHGGVIVEVCFISNANDMRLYNENFERIAENIGFALAN